ncbi:hypothetical protein [[Clostridium] polysaccharolyticum]|uniref:Uncharacterized protein n=1 Tax=[Clostridium] polysaccharolyticum TaxID=29364 RepID=A0A1I0CSV6_9FIRM|nr:hypothetical protein [[Clostridium] polysaccharolyticum]SET22870.1 hypothetical protein SAMN04487772_11152 [[Clostridium] polysaccharolyticum]
MKRLKSVSAVFMIAVLCSVSVQIQGRISSYMDIRCSHLREYSYFQHYNQNHFFNQFELSEVWRDGAPYYELFAPDERIKVQVNREQTRAAVYYLGKSVTFPIYGFLSANANVYLADITEDGFCELIYNEPVSGIDGNNGNCVVVDLRRMELITYEEDVSCFVPRIKIEPVRQAGKKTICKATDANHHIYFGEVNGNIQEVTEAVWNNSKLTVEYDVSQKKLKGYACFSAKGGKDIFGDISGCYTYNVDKKRLELGEMYSVTVWNPVIQNEKGEG